MTVVSLLATFISSSGFPETAQQWYVLAITVAGVVITYVAKNWIAPSTSSLGGLNFKDMISGIVLAIGATFSSYIATLATSVDFAWDDLWKLTLSVLLGYFSKTIFQKPKPVVK